MKDSESIELYKAKLLSSPLLHPLNQKELIQQYNKILDQKDQLNLNGNCFGLCLDFTRHTESHRNTDTQPDYIEKLNRKMSHISPNFGKRIAQYQDFLNFNDSGDSVKILDSTDNFITHYCSNSDHVIGLCLYQKKLFDSAAHIVAIEPVLDPDKNIRGYRIFDPNFGIFDFSKADNIADNLAVANETLQDLMKLYELYGYKQTKLIDLSTKAAEFSLIKKQDEDFYKDQKYLDGSPNLPQKELFLVLKYAMEKNNHKIINGLRASCKTPIMLNNFLFHARNLVVL